MTVGSIVVPVVLLVLAAVPGLHFDLVRGRRERARPGDTLPRFSRVVVAGTMVTTVTSILLGVLGQAVVPSPHRLLDEGGAAVPPLAAAWTACCFLALSLTLSSLAAAVLARLENRPGPFPAEARPAAGSSADYGDRDVELEITLNSGETFRGLLGEESAARGSEPPFITLCGPIFQLDGHGKPLPLDALHWDRMVVPTRSVTSVLVRPVEEQPPPPAALRGVPSRHSAPRLHPSDQLKIFVEQCYACRLAPGPLAKLLALELVVIALAGAVAGAIT
ncbi:hypothetical protein GCM10010402_02390 [Actinomadura luteofluorescens]|uniref:DUF6338 family protein n=1 Tax=Actinomadura luteofluorescens TaxID=46163 RepID=UPI0021646576|nr:DUF6338 family protein [Actinomadura glauciflava]MCR3740551.1 hypothetical protein [Actinomadura glauciflava]